MRTTSRLNSCSSKYRFSPRPSQRNRNARANQLELVVAMALASTSSLMALVALEGELADDPGRLLRPRRNGGREEQCHRHRGRAPH